MKSLAGLLLLVLLTACKQSRKIPDDFDYGKIENNIYRNKYFGFEILVPATWEVQNKEQMKQIRQEGQKIMEEKNKELADQIKATDVNSASLLTVFKNKSDSLGSEYNISFGIIAENLRGIGRIKKGADYLEQVKSLMKKSGVSYRFAAEIHSKKLGNKDFDLLEIIMTMRGVDIQQYYYATIEKGFALCMVTSFVTKQQEIELQDVVNTIRFR